MLSLGFACKTVDVEVASNRFYFEVNQNTYRSAVESACGRLFPIGATLVNWCHDSNDMQNFLVAEVEELLVRLGSQTTSS